MPAFLEPDQFEPWQLDPDNQDSDELLSLIRTYPADRMAMHPVGSWVNKGVEGIRCVERVETKDDGDEGGLWPGSDVL